MVASANLLGHLVGAIAAARFLLPGGRRVWLLGALALSATTTAAMGLTAEMAAFMVLRFAGGLASALAIVFASGLVLDRLAAAGRSELSWMPFAGVGAGIAVSAVLVSGMTVTDAEWESLWLGERSARPARAGCRRLPRLGNAGRGACTAARRAGRRRPGSSCPHHRLRAVRLWLRDHRDLHLADGPTTPEVAAVEEVVWVVVGLSAAPSVALWVWLDRRLGNCTAFALACLVEGAGIAASVFESNAAAVLVAAAVLGGTFMGITALGLITAQRLSTGGSTRRLALMTASFGLGQMIGPTFAGYAYRIGDSFQVPSLTAAAALLVAAALTFRLRP